MKTKFVNDFVERLVQVEAAHPVAYTAVASMCATAATFGLTLVARRAIEIDLAKKKLSAQARM